MALKIDLIENSEYHETKDGKTAGRTAYVSGIVAPSTDILVAAGRESGMPQKGDAYPADVEMVVVERHVVGQADDQARVAIMYEGVGRGQNPDTPGEELQFTIEDDSGLAFENSQIHPSRKESFTNFWRAEIAQQNPDILDVATVGIPVSLRRVVMTGIVRANAQQLQRIRDQSGMVNKSPWLGKPKAYWRFSSLTTTNRDTMGIWYTVRAVVETQNVRDWRQLVVLKDSHTGQWVKVSDAVLAELEAQPYEYKVTRRNGVMMTGNYDLADFQPMFGIG